MTRATRNISNAANAMVMAVAIRIGAGAVKIPAGGTIAVGGNSQPGNRKRNNHSNPLSGAATVGATPNKRKPKPSRKHAGVKMTVDAVTSGATLSHAAKSGVVQ